LYFYLLYIKDGLRLKMEAGLIQAIKRRSSDDEPRAAAFDITQFDSSGLIHYVIFIAYQISSVSAM
jgi:hypothetical protein